ncbi:hypothetical protein K435DRAFT_810716 [Dendrothele bispora CBS 962.96]|uniref:Uncharacterized protein n=1 Tax=Dendrothele bispora (strain CBS 962.96) TaxID=1314807 RepID=A0A4S8KUB3_DENBC|nr:hypothetical protein K435DRAFT_810716 [Dendrothele bispora CBS 962.96]
MDSKYANGWIDGEKGDALMKMDEEAAYESVWMRAQWVKLGSFSPYFYVPVHSLCHDTTHGFHPLQELLLGSPFVDRPSIFEIGYARDQEYLDTFQIASLRIIDCAEVYFYELPTTFTVGDEEWTLPVVYTVYRRDELLSWEELTRYSRSGIIPKRYMARYRGNLSMQSFRDLAGEFTMDYTDTRTRPTDGGNPEGVFVHRATRRWVLKMTTSVESEYWGCLNHYQPTDGWIREDEDSAVRMVKKYSSIRKFWSVDTEERIRWLWKASVEEREKVAREKGKRIISEKEKRMNNFIELFRGLELEDSFERGDDPSIFIPDA